MDKMMSACGVLCSDCPAYHGKPKGTAHQKRTADAWRRIYGLKQKPEDINCGGCLAADEQVFYTCRKCKARLCCRSKGLSNCAECPVKGCSDLEKAQSVWDQVPNLVEQLSDEDFLIYAQPYCGHRERLAEVRRRTAQERTGSN